MYLYFFWFLLKLFFVDIVTGFNYCQDSVAIKYDTNGASKLLLEKNCTYTIHVQNIPIDASIIIFQAHSQLENITISDQPEALIYNSVYGKNVGLAINMHSSESEKKVWIINQNKNDVQVLIIITLLNAFGPIPGGCNLEFPVEIASYLNLKHDTMRAYIEYQHASFGNHRNEPHPKCAFSSAYMTYEVYLLYLEENNYSEEEYFRKIEYMSNVSSIKQHANKALSYSLHPDTRYSFLMYPNVGVVYSVIAKYTFNNEVKESAYVPVVSYGCSSDDFTEYGCLIKYSAEGQVFLFILSILGFIIAFFGHSIIPLVIFSLGLLISFFVCVIPIGKYTHHSKEKYIIVSITVGVVIGLLLSFLWLWLHHPLILLLLSGIAFGFLLTATVLYTPIGNSELFISDRNFWSFLSMGTLLVLIITLIVPKMMTILGSCIVSCYIMLLFYDEFLGTRLSYITLNIIRRGTSKNIFATNDLPFQSKDILMSTLWVVLSFFAIIAWYKKPFSKKISFFNSYFLFSTENRVNQCHSISPNRIPYQPLLKNGQKNIVYRTF